MAAPKKTAKTETEIRILPPNMAEILLTLIGTTPLVVHAFGEKGKEQLKSAGKKGPKPPRSDELAQQQYENARYLRPDGHDGFPSHSIKMSWVNAARLLPKNMLPMTVLRSVIVVNQGEPLARIIGTPVRREDIVRVGGKAGPGSGQPDLRYRPEYWPWKIPVRVKYDADIISADHVLNLAARGGVQQGIGENRMGKTGNDWGGYEIVAGWPDADEMGEAAE